MMHSERWEAKRSCRNQQEHLLYTLVTSSLSAMYDTLIRYLSRSVSHNMSITMPLHICAAHHGLSGGYKPLCLVPIYPPNAAHPESLVLNPKQISSLTPAAATAIAAAAAVIFCRAAPPVSPTAFLFPPALSLVLVVCLVSLALLPSAITASADCHRTLDSWWD